MIEPGTQLQVIDLGQLPYRPAYDAQVAHLDEVLAAREHGAEVGRLLLVEHPPVITVSKRTGVMNHLLATETALRAQGVSVEPTDRGGDITYHGPGQLVAYPVLDLNRLGLRLHDYMRLLEQTVIAVCERFGIEAHRDEDATGVWTFGLREATRETDAKICAMGVRVRRWISMHGLALNVTTNLEHFDLIVPCGLTGRKVTSLHALLGDDCPSMQQAKDSLVDELRERVERLAASRPITRP